MLMGLNKNLCNCVPPSATFIVVGDGFFCFGEAETEQSLDCDCGVWGSAPTSENRRFSAFVLTNALLANLPSPQC